MTVTQLSEAQKLAIRQASFAVLDAATSFLQHLVRIDTTNPPGLRCREIAVLFKEQLDALGYTSELLPVDPADLPLLAPHDPSGLERVNILGKRKSSSKSPAIVEVGGVKREKTIHFNGHTDVVPCGDIESWTYPPFGAVIHDGTIYGRGVSDMKGGIAAGVWAAEAVTQAGLVLRGTVEQSGCVDEESTGVRNAGLGWLVEKKYISPQTVDGMVITEPLNVENLCLGHRGALWGTIIFHGVASHGATPQRGINALFHACRFVVLATETINKVLLDKFDTRVIPEEAQGASLTFSVLQSGANTNSVPDLATLRFDRRLVPSETLAMARAQIQGVLDALSLEIPELKYTLREDYHTEPIWVDEDQEICVAFKGAIQSALGRPASIVCSPGSDDQRFAVRSGITQTIVYGPGNIRNVHNKDEALSLEDLRASIEVMAIGMCEFLGVD